MKVANMSGGGGQKKTTTGLEAAKKKVASTAMNQMNQPLRNNTKEKITQGAKTAKQMAAKDNTHGFGQGRKVNPAGVGAMPTGRTADVKKNAAYDDRGISAPKKYGPTPQTTRPTPQTTRPTPQRQQAQQKTQQARADMVDQLLSKQYSVREAARKQATVKTPKRR